MSANSEVLDLAVELVGRRSVTPEDGGCQDVVIERLEAAGFTVERLPSGDVANFWARRGAAEPLFAFAGHTDVVPPGPEAHWTSPPFVPTLRDGHLYGRGAADMKGSVAAMVVAAERFVESFPDHPGSIGFLVTGAEETLFADGTPRVIEHLEGRDEKITWCVVGEPSSRDRLGDTIRVGRRGSLTARITVRGDQGHVAYLPGEVNPVHQVLPVLADLAHREWDRGNEHFPPSVLHIVDLHAGVGAENVVPGTVEACLNVRYSTELTEEKLRERIVERLSRDSLDFDITTTAIGRPFLTAGGKLLEAVEATLAEVTGVRDVDRSTGGGTSDGRFIAPTGAEVIELGPINATIHKVDERVSIDDLESLVEVYAKILERLLEPRRS